MRPANDPARHRFFFGEDSTGDAAAGYGLSYGEESAEANLGMDVQEMIQKIDQGYIIASRGQWLPGVYADQKAARLAFKLDPFWRNDLAGEAARNGEPITHEKVLTSYRVQAAFR